MASFVFNHIKGLVANGEIDFVADNTFKVALVDESFFDDTTMNEKTSWGDSTVYEYEITYFPNHFGYDSSQVLQNVKPIEELVDGITTNTILTADNVTYANTSTITARGAVIIRTDNALVMAIDFGSNVSSTNGLFTINFSAPTGFLKIR